MEIILDFGNKELKETSLRVVSSFSSPKITKKEGAETSKTTAKSTSKKVIKDKGPKFLINHWPTNYQEAFSHVRASSHLTGEPGETFSFQISDGTTIFCLGLGEKKKNKELLRRQVANLYKGLEAKKVEEFALELDSFRTGGELSELVGTVAEAIYLADYKYTKFKKGPIPQIKRVILSTKEKSSKSALAALEEAKLKGESVNFVRTIVNDPPNVLNSETFAKEIEKDAKNLPNVKVKILGKAELKKEKMGLFLAVNAGSAYEPQLVHLTYTPKKAAKKSKHYALVGKGLTFDTGGYCIKPGSSMVNMKFDMAGAATVYGAFRAAVLMNSPHRLTCILGMTDNAISSTAVMPDSIIEARSGKMVEILNTDAEGRLVLADCLDYTCDLKPDVIIDAATLTGACLVAVGSEVCAVMGNHDGLIKDLLETAKTQNERMWQLPIIDEYREDIKSRLADIKNLSGSRNAGTAKAAAFLEHFIKDHIKWAHLDIAGIADTQAHLPYCPNFGASGLVVRTLTEFLLKA